MRTFIDFSIHDCGPEFGDPFNIIFTIYLPLTHLYAVNASRKITHTVRTARFYITIPSRTIHSAFGNIMLTRIPCTICAGYIL